MSLDTYTHEHALNKAKGWDRWTKDLPFIPMKRGWSIKPIPPFGGAVARFCVRLPNGTEKSIYFDADNSLGYYTGPYWEVYPVRGDVGRCGVNDVAELVRLIAAKP